MSERSFFQKIFGIKPTEDIIEKEDPTEKIVNTIYIQEEPRGTSGTEVQSGYYQEEYLDTLLTKDRAKIFDKMRRSTTQLKMLLSAVKNPIRTAPREIVAASDDPEHIKHKLLCEKVMFEDIKTSKFISEALLLCEYGNSVFEKTHKVYIDNPILDDTGNVFLQSYIGFKNLGWRSAKTIEEWVFKEKEFIGIRQFADGDLDIDVFIPKRYLQIFTMDQEGDDYEGTSLLRPCYGSYLRQKEYFKLNAIGIEKSMPIPSAEVPVGQENSPQFANLKTVLEKFTTHQKGYITYPQGWNVNLSNGTKYDPSKTELSIDKEDVRMAKSFLASFLELGLNNVGAFSLSNDLSDFFLAGLIYIANILQEGINELLKELVILNFGKQTKYPEWNFVGVKDKAGKELAEILEKMVNSKIIIPDDRLEDHVRKRYSITKKSDVGIREKQSPITLSERIKFATQNRRSS